MKFSGSQSSYGVTTDRSNGKSYIFSAVICFVLLIVTVSVMTFMSEYQKTEAMVLPSFEEAIDSGRYKDALVIYREVQDKIVSADPEDADKHVEDARLLEEMEKKVSEKTTVICNKVRTDRYVPSQKDVEFLNEMQELSSSIVSEWLNHLCEEFLLGTIEKPDMIFVFDQMTPISNFAATAAPLLKEIDHIETATGDVRTAEEYFNNEKYIDSVQTYKSVIEKNEGFVKSYSGKRLDEIKKIMYEPMIGDAEKMLDTYKFYSAEELLSDLAEIFPDDNRISNDLMRATSSTSQTAEYKGSVEVICLRSLIADKDTAFSEKYLGSKNDLHLTGDEFSSILEQLYEKNYCLVDAEGLAGLANETFLVEQNLTLPVGKKPLIIVLENLCYSAADYKTGTCRRLVLNNKGEVCGEYKNAEGENIVSRTAEAIGILDSFVEEHPDFTYDGAKGVITVSGHESCFGYVVDKDQIDDRTTALTNAGFPKDSTMSFSDSEISSNCETVRKIAQTLSSTGWKFASSTYGYINAKKSDMETIKADSEKWFKQIGSLLEPVHMICYPNGDYIFGTDPRAVYLKSKGIRIFFGIGTKPYYTYGDNYLYYDRIMLSPKAFENNDYSRLFDVSKVKDPARNTRNNE